MRFNLAKYVQSNRDNVRYYYDGWVHLLADVDGVRLITNDVCEFLQKVPGEVPAAFAFRS